MFGEIIVKINQGIFASKIFKSVAHQVMGYTSEESDDTRVIKFDKWIS